MYVLLTRIRWIAIYPVERVTHPSNNRDRLQSVFNPIGLLCGTMMIVVSCSQRKCTEESVVATLVLLYQKKRDEKRATILAAMDSCFGLIWPRQHVIPNYQYSQWVRI